MSQEIIRVLLVEDNPADIVLLQESLKEDPFSKYQVTVVERLNLCLEYLKKDNFDVILSDLNLPDSQGISTFQNIFKRNPLVPVMVLSGINDEQVAIAAVQSGAQDYLVKGQIRGADLSRAIRYAIERQQTRAALRASEERFRALIEHSSDGIILLNQEGTILYQSPSISRMFGLPNINLVGHNHLEYVFVDDKVYANDLIQQAVALPQTPQVGQVRYENAGGGWFWLELTATNLIDVATVKAVVVNFRDITERKRLEEDLQTEHDFATRVMTLMGQGLTITDAQGLFIYTNPAFSNLMEQSAEDLKWKSLAELSFNGDKTRIAKELSKNLKGETTTYEARFQMKDGNISTMLINSVPYLYNEKDTGTISVVTDLTQQKRIEEQLRYLSLYDSLTGAFNRAFFEGELARLENSREYPISIFVMDVDKLKMVNDTLGHAAGDKLLIRAVELLMSSFRSSDILARIGGDEFVMILPKTDLGDAKEALKRIKREIQLSNQDHPDLPLSLSIGVASARKSNLIRAFKTADARMYQDKRARAAACGSPPG